MPLTSGTSALSKIIKRLELIKSLILLEEDQEIVSHLSKLQFSNEDKELENIINLLHQKAYSKAMPAIEAFINRHHQVGFYIDPELEGLKLEAKVLEGEVNELSGEKAELEKLIHAFGVRHNNELGELILKILRFRKKQAKGTPREAEAEKDYNDYSQEYEASKDEKIADLTDEELKELKKKYRKASKLCHPDVVRDEQKEMADKIFSELNSAYERNDLQRVREILENLENGNYFVSKSDTINEKILLKAEIEKLRIRINELKAQVVVLKESEAYRTICKISNWDTYFAETKQKLQDQSKQLESEGK